MFPRPLHEGEPTNRRYLSATCPRAIEDPFIFCLQTKLLEPGVLVVVYQKVSTLCSAEGTLIKPTWHRTEKQSSRKACQSYRHLEFASIVARRALWVAKSKIRNWTVLAEAVYFKSLRKIARGFHLPFMIAQWACTIFFGIPCVVSLLPKNCTWYVWRNPKEERGLEMILSPDWLFYRSLQSVNVNEGRHPRCNIAGSWLLSGEFGDHK